MKTQKNLVFLLSVLMLIGCSKDETKTAECDNSNLTYNSGISTIINNNCNTSGCHGAGSSNGVFTSYSGLTSVIGNGKFNDRVINKQDMPQGSSLNQTQLNQLKCWVDNNYPEK